MVKDFLKSYESLSPMIVPRSAQQLAKDDEFSLFATVTFKKHSAEFIHKCREKRWTPRDYKYKEGGKEEEAKEVERLGGEERKVWGEALRMGRTGYSEGAMVWIHALALRVFVETVLRYGLPLEYVCGLVQVSLICPLLNERMLMYTADHSETGQEGKGFFGHSLFLLSGQRLGQRQEGKGHTR